MAPTAGGIAKMEQTSAMRRCAAVLQSARQEHTSNELYSCLCKQVLRSVHVVVKIDNTLRFGNSVSDSGFERSRKSSSVLP